MHIPDNSGFALATAMYKLGTQVRAVRVAHQASPPRFTLPGTPVLNQEQVDVRATAATKPCYLIANLHPALLW
jgi:hypothetical protein